MTKIKIIMAPSEKSSTHTFDLEDLNVTQEQWDKMDDNERHELLTDVAQSTLEQPKWDVCSIESIQ